MANLKPTLLDLEVNMTKQKPPKFKTKRELKSWVYSVGYKNVDPTALKRARKQIKRNKELGN
jgi:hypothetical protein